MNKEIVTKIVVKIAEQKKEQGTGGKLVKIANDTYAT